VAVSLTWDANAKFFATSILPLQFVYHHITYFCLMTMARVMTGSSKNSSTVKKGLAAKAVAAKSVLSNCCVQPTRACKPPTYLTQDQNNEVSRSSTSTAAADKPAKQRNDSKNVEDNDDDDDKKGQKNDGKDNDGSKDMQGGRKVVALMRRKGTARTVVRMMARMRGGTTMMTPCQTATMTPLPSATIAHHQMEYPCEFISICHTSI
jgi:hypothetical protein